VVRQALLAAHSPLLVGLETNTPRRDTQSIGEAQSPRTDADEQWITTRACSKTEVESCVLPEI
jgi:hypothetical protein